MKIGVPRETAAGERRFALAMVPVRQGTLTMNAPIRTLADLVLARQLRHGGHPVLLWCTGHFAVRRDVNGNYAPDRKKSRLKIDPIVALLMALDRALRLEGAPGPSSIYETRGPLSL